MNLVYFLGYALWGYFTLPYQLLRTDIEWTELRDGLLEVDCGTNLPVHSRIQRFWFDTKTGLLKRNDYTPWQPRQVPELPTSSLLTRGVDGSCTRPNAE
jgi:hypothetical protein